MYKVTHDKMGKTLIAAGAFIAALSILLVSNCGGRQVTGLLETESRKEYASGEKKADMLNYPSASFAKEAVYDDSSLQHNTEEYDVIRENEFKGVKDNPLSTFSIDVDTASYTNVRRFINID